MYIKKNIFIILLAMFIIMPVFAQGDEGAGDTRVLPLEEFIVLTCEKDSVFREILLRELLLNYKKSLVLPAEDIILSVQGQYDLDLGSSTGDPQASVSLSKLFANVGATVSAEYGTSYSSATGTNNSELTFSVAVPIAQNAFGKVNRLQDKIAGIEVDVARHQIAEAYEDYLAAAIKIYCSWYSAYENLRVGESSYRESLKLLQNIRDKQKDRIALQIDVDKVNLQVIAKQESLISLSNTYDKYTNMIRQAVRHEGGQSLVPVNPSMYDNTEISFSRDYRDFEKDSRTCKMLKLLEEKSSLEVTEDADALLPSADFTLGYTVEDGEDKVFAGLSFELPIPAQGERAQHETSKISAEQTKLTSISKHVQLHTDLNNLYDQIEKERKLIGIADKKIALSESIAAAEAKNYSYARATLNDLISAVNQLEENRFNRDYHSIQLKILLVEWLRLTDRLIGEKDMKGKNLK